MDFLKNKNNLVVVIAVTVVLLVGGVLFFNSTKQGGQGSGEAFPTEEIIPTVDSSVVVDFKGASKKGEAHLTVKNAPAGTKEIEFVLEYDALSEEGEGAIPQGANGKCDKKGSVWECGEPAPEGRKIVLGTCSSGVCRYHKIQSKIKVNLQFTGSYGKKAYEGEFEL